MMLQQGGWEEGEGDEKFTQIISLKKYNQTKHSIFFLLNDLYD